LAAIGASEQPATATTTTRATIINNARIQFLRIAPQEVTVAETAPSSMDRLIAIQKGIAEAGIIAAPQDLKGEELGLKRLLNMGTILQIPQAGLATTDEKIKTRRTEVLEVLKASIEGVTAAAAAAAKSMPADFRVSITNAPGKDAYPISSFTWMLFYQSPKNKAQGKAMADFLQWALTDGQKFAPDLGYAPLPKEVVALEMAQLKKINVQ